MPIGRTALKSVPGPGFEDAFTLLFAGWAVTGHLAFLSGITLRHYWLLAAALGLAGLTAFAGLLLRKGRPRSIGDGTGDADRGAVTWAAIGLGIILVLCLHRPDGDDRIYLGQQMKALDGPNESFWRMADVAAYNAGYVMSSYEYVRAGFSWLFGVPMLMSYYLLWPALIAAMSVAYQGRLLRLFGVRSLAIGYAIWFVVMLAWGDTHRTPGNFGFVRMFQGKGALISLTIPAAQYYWLRYARHGERRALLLLYATLIAGVGFTPTGIPTGVLLAALFVLATFLDAGLRRGGWKTVTALAGAGVYPVLMGLLMRFYFAHTPESGYLPPELLTTGATTQIAAAPTPSVAPTASQAVVAATVAPELTPTPETASTPTPGPTATPVPAPTPTPALPPTQDVSLVDVFLVLGSGWRARIVIACLLATPFLPRATRVRKLFGIYAIVCATLLALPTTSRLIGASSYTSFAWRWVFVIPFALSTALVAERIATWFDRGWTQFVAVGAMSAAFLLASPLTVMSEANGASFGRPHYKLPPGPEVVLLGYDKPAIREGRRLISPATGAPH